MTGVSCSKQPGSAVPALENLRGSSWDVNPASLLCRQLGVQLHGLGRMLPIFDGETGAPVAPETDARIEALVNHLLDTARQGVDEADDDPARPDSSLGAALDSALAAHLSAGADAAEADAAGAAAAEVGEGAAERDPAGMCDVERADEGAGSVEVGASGAGPRAAEAGAAVAGTVEASDAGLDTAELGASGAGVGPADAGAAQAGAARGCQEQQAQGAAGGATAGEPGLAEAGERSPTTGGAGPAAVLEPGAEDPAAVRLLHAGAQLALAAPETNPAAEGEAREVAPGDPAAGVPAPLEPGIDAPESLPGASTLQEAAAGEAGQCGKSMDPAGLGSMPVAADGGPSLGPAGTAAGAAEHDNTGVPSPSAAGQTDPAAGAPPAAEAPALCPNCTDSFTGVSSPTGALIEGKVSGGPEEPATAPAPAGGPTVGNAVRAASAPAVGPAAGVSGAALGEATTAAAEAVAKAYELHQEGGSAGPAAAAVSVELPRSLSEAERRLLDWHWANLEYGCSACLDQVRPFTSCQQFRSEEVCFG